MSKRNILDNLFTFPIVMVDGESQERKEQEHERLALDGDGPDLDIIVGEAECPYYEFISVTDRWMPGSDESLDKAITGKFDACYVVFDRSGGFIVPWNKRKFKNELKKFIESKQNDEPTIAELVIDKLKKDQENDAK